MDIQQKLVDAQSMDKYLLISGFIPLFDNVRYWDAQEQGSEIVVPIDVEKHANLEEIKETS